jgi:serine/threonine protein kinase
VLELHEKEFCEQRVLKNISSGERVVWSLGTYMGINVLAIKHLAPVDTKRLAFRISLCCHVRHRNIVGMIGVFSDGASYTMLYELPGKGPVCLLDESVNSSLSLWTTPAIVLLCRQLLRGLAELHREGAGKPAVLHRDLQLSSFLLNQKNGAMLMPLVVGAHALGGPVSGCVGARGWRPPECHSGASFDTKSDVFAFSAVLYELREGKFPFSECHFLDIPRKLLSRDRPKLSRSKSEQDAFLVSMIESCWAHNPDDRPSFAALSKRFEKCVVDETEGQEVLENVFRVLSTNFSLEGERVPPSILYLGPLPQLQVSQAALQINDNMDLLGDEKMLLMSPAPDIPPTAISIANTSSSTIVSAATSTTITTALGTTTTSATTSATSISGSLPSSVIANADPYDLATTDSSSDHGLASPVVARVSPRLGEIRNSIGGSIVISQSGSASNLLNLSGSHLTDELGSFGGGAMICPVQLMRAKIESTEYFARSIPLNLVQSTRRLQLCQMRVLDVAHLPTNHLSRHRGATHVLRTLLLVEAGSRVQILTHRYDFVLFDRIAFMANERKMHWSPDQIRSMALQIALGMQFLVKQKQKKFFSKKKLTLLLCSLIQILLFIFV